MYLKEIKKHYKIVAKIGEWQAAKVIKVPLTLDNIIYEAKRTHAPNTYYLSYHDLPKDVQVGLNKVEPIIEDSSYTAYSPTAFLRLGVHTKDNWLVNFEVPLGDLDNDTPDMDNLAKYMKKTSDWQHRDIHFSVE